MTGLAIALTGFAGLEVRLAGEDWILLVRRVDFAADPAFERLHGKEIHPQDLARLLPNWKSLRWTHVPANILSHAESCGRDEQYQVNVKADARSAKDHPQVIAAFLRFMAPSDPA